jgi:hypothetical protein
MKRLQANGLVLIIRLPTRIKFPFTSGRPLPVQSAAALPVTAGTSLVEVSFILKDTHIYYYDTDPFSNVVANDAVSRVTSVIGFFNGSPWGGVYFNSYLASVFTFKHL